MTQEWSVFLPPWCLYPKRDKLGHSFSKDYETSFSQTYIWWLLWLFHCKSLTLQINKEREVSIFAATKSLTFGCHYLYTCEIVKCTLQFLIGRKWSAGCPKIIVPRLCGYCGGAVDSIISVLSKAFDCMAHDLFIAKLKAYGFGLEGLRLIANYPFW